MKRKVQHGYCGFMLSVHSAKLSSFVLSSGARISTPHQSAASPTSAEEAALIAEAQEQARYVNALVLNDVHVPPRFEKLLGRGKQNGFVVLHRLHRHLLRTGAPIDASRQIFRVDELTAELLGARDVECVAGARFLARALGIAPLTAAEQAELADHGSALHQRYRETLTRVMRK